MIYIKIGFIYKQKKRSKIKTLGDTKKDIKYEK